MNKSVSAPVLKYKFDFSSIYILQKINLARLQAIVYTTPNSYHRIWYSNPALSRNNNCI